MSPKEQGKDLTRRDFLKLVAAGAEVLEKGILVYELSKLGIEVAKWGLEVPTVPVYSMGEVLPGNPLWPEGAHPDRPSFINPTHKGHKDFLVYLSTHDPILQRMHEYAFKDLFFHEPEKRIGLGESFWKHIEYAKKALQHTQARPIDYVHAALFTFASIHSNFYTVGDVWNAFRVWDHTRQEPDASYIDIGVYINNIANVFPEDPDDPKMGVDKMMHFAGFAFLGFEKWYTTTHGLPDGKRIPRLATVISNISDDPHVGSELLAASGEFVWELDETQTWVEQMLEQKQFVPPSKGLFEYPGYAFDTLASYMGAHFAMLLAKDDLTMDELVETCTILNNPDQLWPALPITMRGIQVSATKPLQQSTR